MRIDEVINEKSFINKLKDLNKMSGMLPNITTNTATAQKVVFKGPKAQTWDQKAADAAQALEDSGVDAKEIWKQTGTFRNPSGKWRQEISDFDMEFKTGNLKFNKTQKMSDVLDHPELYKAYPQLKNYNFEFQDSAELGKRGIGGYYDTNNKKIVVATDSGTLDMLNRGPKGWEEAGGNKEEWNEFFKHSFMPHGIASHEIQHGIQDVETGFRNMWDQYDSKRVADELGKGTDPVWIPSNQELELAKQLKTKGFKDKYWDRNAGSSVTQYGIKDYEVDARGSQNRIGMPPSVAAETPPDFGDTKLIRTQSGGAVAEPGQIDLPGPTHAQTSGRNGSVNKIKNNPWYKPGNKVKY